jgi:cell division protein FtsW
MKSGHLIWRIFLAGLILSLIGILAIYNASVFEATKDFGDRFHFVRQQFTWLVIASVIAIVTSFVPIDLIKKLTPVLLIVSLILLVLVVLPGIGTKLLGARRWLVIGSFVIQPSEIAKITLILYLSSWLVLPRQFFSFVSLLGLFAFLIMLQPDLGTAIILTGSSVILYYLSGAPIKNFVNIVALGIISVMFLILLSPYRLDRLQTYLDPTSDPLGKGYHINQILNGLGSGGVMGVGLGMSRQKYSFLPEATTDSIFVVIAEEFGLFGASLFILVLIYFIRLLFSLCMSLTDRFAILLASGITMIYLLQMVVNLGSMTALFPLTGIPLPFISYGGSSLTANFFALGLLMNLARHYAKKN